MKVFVNAALSTLAEQRLNEEFISVLRECDLEYYLPQAELPPDSDVSSLEVLRANSNAVRAADVILSILDKPGHGVVFELGYAMALGKRIIAFRTDSQDYLGKILEGVWEGLEPGSRVSSLPALKTAFTELKKDFAA